MVGVSLPTLPILIVQVDVEHGILTRMEKLLDTVCSLSPCASFEFDGNSLNVCKELVQVG